MALPANALTTVAIAAAELDINATTFQTVLERLIGVASDAIEAYCGRGFAQLSRAVTMAPSGGNRLILPATPLVSITSIVDDGTTIEATEYTIEDAALGFIWRDSGWPTSDLTAEGVSCDTIPGTSERTLVVTYTGGYLTAAQAGTRSLPYDLEQACIDVVASLYRRRGVDSAAPVYDSGGAPTRYGGGIIPGSVLPTLNRYRRLV